VETTFVWNGARITKRSNTVRDRNAVTVLKEFLIQRKYGNNVPLVGLYDITRFVEMVVSCKVVEGELPFVLPTPDAPIDELLAAYECYGELPAEFLDAYEAAELVLTQMGKPIEVEKKVETNVSDNSTPISITG
jgi:hypothetical protein